MILLFEPLKIKSRKFIVRELFTNKTALKIFDICCRVGHRTEQMNGFDDARKQGIHINDICFDIHKVA